MPRIAKLRERLAQVEEERQELRPVVELKRELLEIDARFGQLGEEGIFAQLDRAGVLDHHLEE